MTDENLKALPKNVQRAINWVRGSECQSNEITCEQCSVCAGNVLADYVTSRPPEQDARVLELMDRLRSIRSMLADLSAVGNLAERRQILDRIWAQSAMGEYVPAAPSTAERVKEPCPTCKDGGGCGDCWQGKP